MSIEDFREYCMSMDGVTEKTHEKFSFTFEKRFQHRHKKTLSEPPWTAQKDILAGF